MSRFSREWDTWERASPRAVKDGIKTQSKGKTSSWWGKRWIQTLEGFGWSNRLTRGRSYARSGQVTALKLSDAGVTAAVQGSRAKPYQVQIQLGAINEDGWERVTEALQERPIFLGQLLAGDLPPEMESIFAGAGASLFPASGRDLQMSCSCPDWAVPCKHLAAVYYVLAEWIDRDPFLLFELRGKDREAFLAALRTSVEGMIDAPEPEEPLSPDGFWGSELPAMALTAVPPSVSLALLRALGDPPGWSGAALTTRLRPIYNKVSERAEELLSGPAEPDSAAPEPG